MVFTSATVGYLFLIDSNSDFSYVKTTDGGQTWGSLVVVRTGSVNAADIWYDRWTPTLTGTVIHTWYLDGNNIFYRSLDTASDTLGTERTVFAGASAVAGRGVFVTGAKAVGGNLLCTFDIDAGAETGTYRSTDAGVNWGSRTNMMEATLDQGLMFPGNAADTQDMWLLFQDASTDEITLKVHDDSANTNSESTAITMVEQGTDGTGQYGFTGAIRHSDGHLIAVFWNAFDTSTGDLKVYDINGTGSLTAKTDIVTNADDGYYPNVFINQLNNDIYVFYRGKRDGSETLGTISTVFYTKSTNGGTSWTTGDTAYQEAAANTGRQVYAPLMGPRLMAAWKSTSLGTFVTNYVNSVTFGQNADVPVGLLKFTGVAATGSKSAAVPSGLTKYTGVAFTPKHLAPVPIALTKLLGVAPTSTKLAPVPSGLTKYTGVPFTPLKQASLSPVALTLHGVPATELRTVTPEVALLRFQRAVNGPYYGTSGFQEAGADAVWVTPGNAVTSNNTPATATPNPKTNPLSIFDFNSGFFGYPPREKILGLYIEILLKVDAGSVSVYSSQLMKSDSPAGNAVIHSDPVHIKQTDYYWHRTKTYDIVADYGSTLNGFDLDNGFGIYLVFTGSGVTTLSVDDVRICLVRELATKHDAPVPTGLLKLTGIPATEVRPVPVDVSVIHISNFPLDETTGQSVQLTPVAVNLHPLSPTVTKQAPVPTALTKLTPLAPTVHRPVPVPVSVLHVSAPAISSTKTAAVASSSILFLGVAPTTRIDVLVPPVSVHFILPLMSTTGGAAGSNPTFYYQYLAGNF
jgi:hypothetical protein